MLMTIDIDINSTQTQIVGTLPECIISHYSLQCVSLDVYMPPGVMKHLHRRGHWEDFTAYYQDIPGMISLPDYVGQNPKEPNTVEIYKILSDHVILPIKLNEESGLFMSSFYVLDNGASKIEKRLRSSRILSFADIT